MPINYGMKGKLAVCSKGYLGLITSEDLEPLFYGEGPYLQYAYTGVHLSPEMAGKFWCSRNPQIIGDAGDVAKFFVQAGEVFHGFEPQRKP